MLLAPPVFASAPNTGGKPWDSPVFPSDGPIPTMVVDHMKCVITEVRDNRVVEIWDQQTRSRPVARFAEEIPIEARQRKDFGGRSSIGFEDLEARHRVKLTYRTGDGTIVGAKVIDRVRTLPADWFHPGPRRRTARATVSPPGLSSS